MVELMELVNLLSFLKDPMLAWLVVGLFVGWHVKQPSWAKVLEKKVVLVAKMLFGFVKKLLKKE